MMLNVNDYELSDWFGLQEFVRVYVKSNGFGGEDVLAYDGVTNLAEKIRIHDRNKLHTLLLNRYDDLKTVTEILDAVYGKEDETI